MGFKVPEKHYRIKFPEPELADFECVMRSATVAEIMSTMKAMTSSTIRDAQAAVASSDAMTPEDMQRILNGMEDVVPLFEDQFKLFAKAIVSWNLEDANDQPIPPTYENILQLDNEFVTRIMQRWQEANSSVDPTSQSDSNSGETSQEQSMSELVALSRSPSS